MKFKVEKIVGGTAEEKKDAERILRDAFEFQDMEDLEVSEVELSPEMLECIDLANKVVGDVLRTYGVASEPIPQKNVHLIKNDSWPSDLPESAAFFMQVFQAILVHEGGTKIHKIKYLIHEFFHFQSYLTAQVLPDKRVYDYRVGISIVSRDGETTFLEPLNEALTEELTIEAMKSDAFRSTFKEHYEEMYKNMKHHADAVTPEGAPLFSDETFFVQVEAETDGNTPISTSAYSYPQGRKAFNLLLDKLMQNNDGVLKDRTELRNLFVSSVYTGKLMSIGRLVERSFGEGSFRALSMCKDGESLLRFVESLK